MCGGNGRLRIADFGSSGREATLERLGYIKHGLTVGAKDGRNATPLLRCY
jgi:hypothetical protein